jgi:dynein heavy chain, axonemal
MQGIEVLPLVQTPEVFGLHANADIQYYTNATRDLWRTLTELQPRTAGSGSGITREEFIGNVAKDVLFKTPDMFDLPVIAKELGTPSPTQVVLLQELARWNQCVHLTGKCTTDNYTYRKRSKRTRRISASTYINLHDFQKPET